MFEEDGDVGAKVMAAKHLKSGTVIRELCGRLVTVREPFLKPGRNDFSVVHSNFIKKSQLWLGPAAYANHDCENNYEIHYLRSGVACLRTNRPIPVGEEITAFYGDQYFGENNVHCLCTTCKEKVEGAYANTEPSLVEKQFLQCSHCPARFRFKSWLVRHLSRHGQIDKFACWECGESFSRKSSLKRHAKGHDTELTKFQCTLCRKSFTRKEDATTTRTPSTLHLARTPKRKLGSRQYKNYSIECLNEAITKIANGDLSILAASKLYNISYGTLHNKYNGNHIKKTGSPTVFSDKDEMAFLTAAIKCGQWGFPLTLMDLRLIAKLFLDSKGIMVEKFSNNLPGRDWAQSMLNRHNNLACQRVATNIARNRAEVSPEIISEYFDNLQKVIENVSAQNIYNYDESNLQDNPGKLKMIFQRGTKYSERIQNHSKSATSIMVCGSAAGVLLPPYIIFKASEMWQPWTVGGPKGQPCCSEPCCSKGSRFNRTAHGWIDGITFKDWFLQVFCFMQNLKRVIGDNLSSHIQHEIFYLCEQNNIDFVCLPKNSTHLTQPLDVGFFRPLKQEWRNCLNEWKNQNTRLKAILKSSFPTLATSIFSLNKQCVLEKLPQQDNSVLINDKVTDYLKSQRYFNSDENARKKRKKITVTSGASITSVTLGLVSSDEEIELNHQLMTVDDSESDHEANDESIPEYQEPSTENFKIGTFILVKVKIGKRCASTYMYLAVINGITDNIIKVTGLKSIDTSKQTFKLVKCDVFDVSIKNIQAALKFPVIEGIEDSIKYKFPHSVDVREV
ncbi:hypothetical protein AGLY_003403 [Aphis glycines]|uniref:SET domain-containing protein n=1 Tax=Aphis glycines TaxID=307491 RepID=A0A6G0U213_APHGL|nr:hypothetical protein AGLY_003403 [Aphis glycines]